MKSISLIIILALTGCVTGGRAGRMAGQEPCEDWYFFLGASHQCTNADGGALGPSMLRREISQKVVTEGYPLPHKEYGLSALVFHDDGSYRAHKLHFTWYFRERAGRKIYLVYAEDAKGRYRIEEDGAITLKAPDTSTCDAPLSGSETIYPHLQNFGRRQPYRTSIASETAIVFATKGWLGAFHGSSYWNGRIESRRDYKMPPFPEDTGQALTYDFEGLTADIYYGCLVNGFESFEGRQREAIRLVDEFRYEAGVDPKDLSPRTRFRVSP